MAQLSETTPSTIGTVYLTTTGLVGGVICRVIWKESDWSPIRNAVDETLYGYEVQQVNIGGTNGTYGWQVSLEFVGAYDVLYAALLAQRNTIGTTFPAVLHMSETDGAGAEKTVTFTKLLWVDLNYGTDIPFGARIYQKTTAKLISVE